MTVLLVLCTLITLLIADYVVQRRRERVLAGAVSQTGFLSPAQWHLSDDLMLAPNHLWFRREQDNSITVGLDNFLSALTGVVEKIQLPEKGATVSRTSPAIVLSDKNKSLRFALPLEGQVMKVNQDVLRSPALANRSPYTGGWLFNFLPFDENSPVRNIFQGDAAIEWLKEQHDRVKVFFAGQAPQLEFVTMQDGGVPVDGVLKGFDGNVWEEFQQQFVMLPTDLTTKEIGDYDNA